MDFMIRAVGFAARTVRPRGRHLVANVLHRMMSGRTLRYRDRWGTVHVARLADEAEALGFVGKPALPRELHHRVKHGDWTIDVGANVGVLTAELCHLVGRAGTVWAIEPFPPNIRKLEDLRRVNGLIQLDVLAGALSSGPGVAGLRLPGDGSSAHPSLAKTSDLAGEIEVQTWCLDDLVAERRPAGPLTFIKIDVEGHEIAVLEGARNTLQAMRPLILCEFNDVLLREGGSSWAELLDRFRHLDYRPILALREGRPLARIQTGLSPGDLVPMSTMVVDILFEPN
jgi:FkbM family methyltransferase